MNTDWSSVGTEQAVQCLRLHLVQGIGPLRFRNLIEHFSSVEAILRAPRRELERVKNIGPATSEAIRERHDEKFVEEELRRAENLGIRVLCREDDDYPALLKEIPDAPICLYVKGTLSPKDKTALAIVGPRRCSQYGQEQGYQFGMAATRVGMTVVSGLARGVDAQAHLGALDCRGRTIAVIGSGLGHLDEHHNRKLAERIAEDGGAVISELPIDRPADAENFPPRNRIIAGISLGTLVIEAARRSGALITASQTLDYNRELFALPGRIDYGSTVGTNNLIKTGQAKLTMTIDDILEEFHHAAEGIREIYQQLTFETTSKIEPELSSEERSILDALSIEGVDLEQVLNTTKLPPERISSGLTMLQLKGVVEQLPGNRFARIGAR
jgi:DNA processing protein